IKTGNIIRPLLFAQKQEIVNYANENGLKWRTDISNIDNKYARNLIRNKVLPVLKEINPKILDTFSNTIDKINAVSSIFVQWIESLRNDVVENRGEDIFIAKSKILDWEIYARELILFEIIRLYGFNYNQAKNVCASIDEIGKLFISETHHLNIDRDLIIISKIPEINTRIIIEKGDKLIELNGSNIVMEVHDKKINIEPDANVAYLDLDDLVFPLEIRNWIEGDSFVPLGMKGEKKLSDFMIDEKIPLNLKSRVLVVTSAGNIVWIVGHRIDDRYKITENTTRTCRLKFLASS
ncbi:MAG: tRNA lysidine(34) synthetase TilS, partial [Thermodesulfobacteriota bacterium]